MLVRILGPFCAVLIIAMFAFGCGGGGTNATPGDGSGDDTPGFTGDVNGPPSAADFPKAQSIVGDWPDAPLGTTAAYAVQPAAADTVSRVASKTISSLDPGQVFKIEAATVALPTVAQDDLDWEATNLTFTEGSRVKLWMRYEVAPTVTYNRTWNCVETNLNYNEGPFTESSGSIYTVSFDYTLPYLPGADNSAAVFLASLSLPKAVSAVIIVNPGDGSDAMAQVPFQITKVPTDPYEYSSEEAQMGWEDLIVNSDYDYNDFVARMRVTERRRKADNKLVQIDMTVKAIARGAGYDGSWQFNMDSAFPGATAVAYVQQYYYDGTPHGNQRIWKSTDGTSIPVFASNKVALVQPPESYATNTVAGSKRIYGDYAEVIILFDQPVTYGTYTPMPYSPQLRVYASNGSVYIVGLWTRRGDPVDSNGRPLGFIIPDTYKWPMEGRKIWYGYPRFNDWVTWVNSKTMTDAQQPKFWDDAPVLKSGTTWNVFDESLFH